MSKSLGRDKLDNSWLPPKTCQKSNSTMNKSDTKSNTVRKEKVGKIHPSSDRTRYRVVVTVDFVSGTPKITHSLPHAQGRI